MFLKLLHDATATGYRTGVELVGAHCLQYITDIQFRFSCKFQEWQLRYGGAGFYYYFSNF